MEFNIDSQYYVSLFLLVVLGREHEDIFTDTSVSVVPLMQFLLILTVPLKTH